MATGELDSIIVDGENIEVVERIIGKQSKTEQRQDRYGLGLGFRHLFKTYFVIFEIFIVLFNIFFEIFFY